MDGLRPVFPIEFLTGWYIHWCNWSIKVPHYIVLPISPFLSVMCFIYLDVSLLGAYLQMLYLLFRLTSLSLCNAFVSYYSLCFYAYFTWQKFSYPSFVSVSMYLHCIFLSLHFWSVCTLISEVSLFYVIHGWDILSPFIHTIFLNEEFSPFTFKRIIYMF